MHTSVLAVESFNIHFILGVSCFWHCNDVFVHVHIGEFKVAIFLYVQFCVCPSTPNQKTNINGKHFVSTL